MVNIYTYFRNFEQYIHIFSPSNPELTIFCLMSNNDGGSSSRSHKNLFLKLDPLYLEECPLLPQKKERESMPIYENAMKKVC